MVGFSMLIKLVLLFLTTAKVTLRMEIVLNVSRDMTSRKENVFSLTSITLSPQISDVELGTGTIRYALLAQTVGFSMLKKLACPSAINVNLILTTVTVPLATKDTTSRKANAFSLTSITLSPPIPDAELGTGTIRYALLAQTVGFSTLIRSACQFQTSAKVTVRMATVPLATKDTTSRKANAFSLTSTMLVLLILDVLLGTGIIKFA